MEMARPVKEMARPGCAFPTPWAPAAAFDAFGLMCDVGKERKHSVPQFPHLRVGITVTAGYSVAPTLRTRLFFRPVFPGCVLSAWGRHRGSAPQRSAVTLPSSHTWHDVARLPRPSETRPLCRQSGESHGPCFPGNPRGPERVAHRRRLARGLAPFKCSIRAHCDDDEVAAPGLARGPAGPPAAAPAAPPLLRCCLPQNDRQKIEKHSQTSVLLSQRHPPPPSCH